MFVFFGGGKSIPGVASDNRAPGGEIIDGQLKAGSVLNATNTIFHNLYGSTTVRDSIANAADFADTLDVIQNAPLNGFNPTSALFIFRNGALNGFDYSSAALAITDNTGGTSVIVQVQSTIGTLLRVDQDGPMLGNKIKTNTAITHTLGAYSGNAVPIYDESGTLLGYMPLYA